MIDIVIRHCGHGEWLPLIVVNRADAESSFIKGAELYRGERQRGREAAWNKAIDAWNSCASGNIAQFKSERGIV